MNRKEFIEKLSFLLQDISDEERHEALDFYENYFDEAGIENEQKVILELKSPERVAAITKDGLKGQFEERIYAGNQGFSNDDYEMNYEITEPKSQEKKENKIFDRWKQMDSQDRLILVIIGIVLCIPITFSIFGIVGGVFGIGFSAVVAILCVIFGLWIVTFIFHLLAVILMVIGGITLFIHPGAGMIYLGAGCILIGLGTTFGKLASWFFKDCIPHVVDTVSNALHKIFHSRSV